MNNVLNRIKTIKTLGSNRYFMSDIILANYSNKESWDYYSNEIIGRGFSIDNVSYTKFLVRQHKDIMKYFLESISPDNFGLNQMFDSFYKLDNIHLCTESDVDFFLNLVNSGFYLDYEEIYDYYIHNPNRRGNLNDILIKSEYAELGLYNFYKEKYGDNSTRYECDEKYSLLLGRFMLAKNILSIAENDAFLKISADDIRTIVLRNKKFSLSYDKMTLDEIEILLNPLCEYIPSVKKENIFIVNILKEYLPDEYLSKLRHCNALFSKVECVENLIQVLKDSDNIVLLTKILDACILGFIQNEKDLSLITNKIKFGEKFKTNRDFAYVVSGIKANLQTIKDCDYARLISIKRLVSKNFYKNLLSDLTILKNTLDLDTNLFSSLSNIIELGQLNTKEYELILKQAKSESNCIHYLSKTLTKYKLTFKELMEILKNPLFIEGESLNDLKSLKPSERFLKIKDLIVLKKTLSDDEFIFKNYNITSIFEGKLFQNEFKNNNPLKLDTLVDYLNYKAISSKLDVNSIEDYRKLLLIQRFMGIDNMNNMSIDEALLQCGCMNSVMDRLNLSDEFKVEYAKDIIKFFSSEDFILLYKYLNNKKPSKAQKDSALLIAKSIIANKYSDLKFVYEDVLKEAGANISRESFDIWKRTDETSSGKYTISDSSDFKYIMRMGEIPVRSCMHYETGAYSQCLLSNFDTTKKILTIHKNGKYVGRAILRLTKMADENYTGNNELKFIDVDFANSEVAATETGKEHLIIFLEKAYTTLDKNDFKLAYNLMIEHLKGKALLMGVDLVASKFYNSFANETCAIENKYVYITQSKNGQQYLDSFDGSTSNSKCYKAGEVLIY